MPQAEKGQVCFDQSELKAVLEEIFEERQRINAEEHHDHHEWIAERILAEKARQEMYKEARRILMQWSIPAICTTALYFLQNGKLPI
jgi:hypothetical protein